MLQRAQHTIASVGARPPSSVLLKRTRARAAATALERHGAAAAALRDGLVSGDAAARNALERVAARALDDMRAEVAEQARRDGLAGSCAAALDRWWRDTDTAEYLDNDNLDPSTRVRIVAHLDRMNELLQSYWAFFAHLRPLLDQNRATTVLDVASGHGGFAVAAARLAADAGLPAELTASDIKPEYLSLGEKTAREKALDVRFVLQDALDLTNLRPGSYDVLTCTQSLHHFSPGQVAVMFSEASRVARRGVVFIDGERGALNAAAIASLGLFVFRDRAFTHDVLISFRRFFVAEELQLLAALTPLGRAATARWIPPGHCVLSLAKP
jgi:2-polyprenyl-3-methyl-5-hydroxy-6-metoxy-1,4-benzoquinol methylase